MNLSDIQQKTHFDKLPYDLLFFRREFHSANIDESPLYLIHEEHGDFACFIYHSEEGSVTSGKSVSFGGFYFSSGYKFSQDFVENTIEYFKKTRSTISITLPPEVYFKNDISGVLTAKSSEVIKWYNHHLEVNVGTDLYQSWNYSDLKKYRKCERAKFAFRKLAIGDYENLYEVVRKGWGTKGYQVSMSKNHLHKMIKTFPKEYLMYGVYDGMELIAGAFTIRVTSKILYVFYLGFLPEYKLFSPNRYLMSQLYKEAQNMSVEIIDMGTSINEGVREFKKRLGCTEDYKFRFQL